MSNVNPNKDVMIAYHTDCIDGFTSAWITHKELTARGYDCILGNMDYNDEYYAQLESAIGIYKPARLFIVDFSVPMDMLAAFEEHYPAMEVVILDHHKTAFENYNPQGDFHDKAKLLTYIHSAHILLDNNLSGAGVCWNYFNPGCPLPKIIKYVQDYDLYRFEYGEDTKYVNKYLRSLDKDILDWEGVADLMETNEGLKEVLAEGQYLQANHDHEVNLLTACANPFIIDEVDGLIVHCGPEHASAVGNVLAEMCGTFGATFYISSSTNKIKWSLRSKGEFDVSAIAKRYGGGGHKNAAGFETDLLSTEIIESCLTLS